MEACIRAAGKVCKSLGKSIDAMGVKMEGRFTAVEERMSTGLGFSNTSTPFMPRSEVPDYDSKRREGFVYCPIGLCLWRYCDW